MSALILHQKDGRSSFQYSLPPVIKCPNTSEIPFTSGQADHLSAAASHSQQGEQGWPGSSWEPGQAAGAEHLWSPGVPRPWNQDWVGSSGERAFLSWCSGQGWRNAVSHRHACPLHQRVCPRVSRVFGSEGLLGHLEQKVLPMPSHFGAAGE